MNNSSVIGTFNGKCCDGNVFNNNDMKLSRQLFTNLLSSDEYKNAMKNRYYIGFLGHPEDPNCMDFRNACIVMTECHMDDKGEVFGSFDLVNTPVGQVVKSFIDAGVTFGISIRGAGDVDGQGNVDPDTFVFRGFDLVTFPAYDDCVPEFRAIAASSDLDKQVKYKKVCASVSKNLPNITSAEALNVIQSQFNEGSDEYNAISDRLDQLNSDDSLDNSSSCDVLSEQLAGMTDLFLTTNKQLEAANARIEELEEELSDCQLESYNSKLECSRKIQSLKRIAATQIHDVTCNLDDVEEDNSKLVTANTDLKKTVRDLKARLEVEKQRSVTASAQISKLNSKISELEESNLKYVHKIEANSKTISQKDSTISKLEGDLRETVTANTKFKKETSNLDENVRNLQSRVEAAEQMVLEYQQAYANMYANALGVHISNLSVTASTSVSEMQDMISSRAISDNRVASSYQPCVEALDVCDESDIVTI